MNKWNYNEAYTNESKNYMSDIKDDDTGLGFSDEMKKMMNSFDENELKESVNKILDIFESNIIYGPINIYSYIICKNELQAVEDSDEYQKYSRYNKLARLIFAYICDDYCNIDLTKIEKARSNYQLIFNRFDKIPENIFFFNVKDSTISDFVKEITYSKFNFESRTIRELLPKCTINIKDGSAKFEKEFRINSNLGTVIEFLKDINKLKERYENET